MALLSPVGYNEVESPCNIDLTRQSDVKQVTVDGNTALQAVHTFKNTASGFYMAPIPVSMSHR